MAREEKNHPNVNEVNELVKHIENSSFEEAILRAQKIINEYPIFQFGWKALGVAFQYNGQIHEALKAHLKAVELDKNDSEAYSNLGNCQSELGLLHEAEISHREAIKINSLYAQAYSNLGIVLQKLGKLEEAALCHEKAVSLEPNLINFKYNLSLSYLEINKLIEAENCLKNIIKINPNFTQAYSYLAIVLKKLGRLDEALKISDLSLQIDENSYHANYANASILFDIGDLSNSLEKLKKANSIRNEIHTEVAIKNLYQRIENSNNQDENKEFQHLAHRFVNPKLIECLCQIEASAFDKRKDARYGNGRCSKDFNLFNTPYDEIKKLSTDLYCILQGIFKKKYILSTRFLM